MRLDDAARRGLTWLVLGAGVVAVFWTIGVANPAFGYFMPGCVTLLWLIFVVTWWAAWYSRFDGERRAVAAQQREVAFRAAGLDRIDTMSGVEFEQYVAAVFRGLGYQVSMTKATGDFGVDIIATMTGTRTAVQCKRQGSPVGGAAVQQVVAGAPMHKCTATMVVCNRTFTRAAQALALTHGCRLIDRTELESLALQTSKAARAGLVSEGATARRAASRTPANGKGPSRWQLIAATGVTITVLLIGGGIALNSKNSRQEAQAEQEAAAKTAPCPQPMSQLLETSETLVPLPDLVGLNAEDARVKLELLGLTEINWESANPDYSFVIDHRNWTVVGTSPRAGCEIGASDRPTISVTK